MFCMVIVAALLGVGFFYFRNYVLLNNLRTEVDSLTKLNVSSDRYNRKIKTSGDYVIVEKTIKEYLDEYAVLLQDTVKIKKDEKFTKILAYENYEKDGPDFLESLSYLSDSKTSFNGNIEKLLKMSEEEAIIEYGKSKIDDPYYLDLYEELILSSSMKDSFWSTKDGLITMRDDINSIIDQSTTVLNLLVSNKNYWKLEDGEIKIMSQNLYDQYIAIINNLNQKKEE